MGKIENSMECIEALMDKMLAKGVSTLHLKDNDFEIKIETACGQSVISQPVTTVASQVVVPAPVENTAPPAPSGNIVKAPSYNFV